jgi:glycosyltransferase involved in cell wall biosynthesis
MVKRSGSGLHLAINATEVGRRRGGNESYIAGLVEGLAALDPPVRVSLLTCDGGRAQALGPAFRQVDLGPYRRLPFFLWQQSTALRRLGADWYISTFFLPPLLPCRGAVLVHDLSFRAHAEYFPPAIALYMRLLTGLAIRQAARVVALSRFTADELARFYPACTGKTAVVYPGVGQAFSPVPGPDDERVVRAYGLAPGYILAMGNIHPRKNLARLLDAYLRLRQEKPETPAMAWVGLERWDSAQLVARARAAGVGMIGFVAQEDLPALYRQAAMLVYPSLYEGFGLPPLEAMACGTPVVASSTTSLPEAVGDAGLTVDPADVEGLAATMARLLEDAPLWSRLQQAGLDRVRAFTWKGTAQHLLTWLGVC